MGFWRPCANCTKSIYLVSNGKKWDAYDDGDCLFKHRCIGPHKPYFFD